MATRIRCSFCDYVMDAPETASTNTSRIEWTCLGCDSPIIVEASPSALGSALRTAPLQPGSAGVSSLNGPKTSPSSLSPSAVEEVEEEAEVASEPAPPAVEQAAAPPPSRNTLPALGASPPAAASWSSHRSPPPPPPRAPRPPRRTAPPPPPPLKARQSSSPPPPLLEALGSKKPRVSLLPLTPPPHTHTSSLEARSVSGVQSLRATSADERSVAPSKPATLLPPAPRSERTSNTDARPAPTQRSAQAPRWVYGALAAATLASGGVGYLLHDASRLLVDTRETQSASPASAPAPLELATHEPDEPAQVVEASYAPPAAENPATISTGASPESDSVVAHAVQTHDLPPAQAALPTAKQTADNLGAAPARIAAPPLAAALGAPAPVATPPSAPRAIEAAHATPALQKLPVSAPAPAAAIAGTTAARPTAPSLAAPSLAAPSSAAPVAAPSVAARPVAPSGTTPPVGAPLRVASTPPTPESAAPGEEATPSLPAFDKGAARLALDVAGARAQSCRQASDPAGSARIIVTFAPSGRVTTATVSGAPYAGTTTGGCIATAFRGAAVPAFAGPAVTVTKTVGLN